MKNRNRLIMGTALGVAAIAITIDHTRHRLPEPVPAAATQPDNSMYEIIDENGQAASPCSLSSPCAMGENGGESGGNGGSNSSPCSLDNAASPCSL